MNEGKVPRLAGGVHFRLIVSEESEGRWNMAVDEALLESVGSAGADPVVRFYGFSPPTLSVGRFQRAAGIVDLQGLQRDGGVFVRRPSGGQAVFHAGELTYAFILGKNHLVPFGKRYVYRYAAPILLSGLREIGIVSHQANPAGVDHPLYPDCFASSGEYEIDSDDGLKMVGSAQMVSRDAALQHGSIPITADGRRILRYVSGLDPTSAHAGNIQDQLGREISFESVRRAFVKSLGLTLPLRAASLTPDETERAEVLLAEKYDKPEWNERY